MVFDYKDKAMQRLETVHQEREEEDKFEPEVK